MSGSIFQSFFQAGFECSTHRVSSGKRLDLVASTQHDQLVRFDYLSLLPFGITTVREGARWHRIEQQPGIYNFETLEIIFDAAQECGIEVVLDLFHFGWPDHIDIFGPGFIDRFEAFASAAIDFLRRRGIRRPFIAPVNEISFMAWAAGDEGFIHPYTVGKGPELKRILARAVIVTTELIRRELPGARLIAPEPAIHIIGDPEVEGSDVEAEMYRRSQFEAWDMISGKLAPALGGRPEHLYILGVNFYDRNEWVHNSKVSLKPSDPRYRPFRQILDEIWQRYRKPLLISETGTEDEARADWLHYVCREVQASLAAGIPIHGICWYPIANHAGWIDDRYCCNGLFDYPDEDGNRPICSSLAEALRFQINSGAFNGLDRKTRYDGFNDQSRVLFAPSLEVRVPTAPAPDEQVRTS